MDLQSLGHAAALFQQDPRILEVCLRGVGAKMEFALNGVGYWRAGDFVQAVKFLAGHDAEMALDEAKETAAGE